MHVWNPSTGADKSYVSVGENLAGVVPTKDGRALCWNKEGLVVICDLETGERLSHYTDFLRMWQVSALPDGQMIVGDGYSYRGVLDPDSGEINGLEMIGGWTDGFLDLGDGSILAWNSSGDLRLCNLGTSEIRSLPAHSGEFRKAVRLSDGRVASWSEYIDQGFSYQFRVWDFRWPVGDTKERDRRWVIGGVLSPERKGLFWLSEGAQLVCDLDSGACQMFERSGDRYRFRPLIDEEEPPPGVGARLLRHDSGLCASLLRSLGFGSGHAVLTPDRKVVTWSAGEEVRVHGPENRQRLTLQGHTDCIRAGIALENGRLLTSSWDYTMRLWDLETGACVGVKEQTSIAYDFVQLIDGRVVYASFDSRLRCLDLVSGTEEVLTVLDGAVSVLMLLPDGRPVAAINNLIWIGDATADRGFVLEAPGYIAGVAPLPERNRLLSWSRDGWMVLWTLEFRAKIATACLDNAITACVVDEERNVAAVADGTNRVHLFDLPD